MSDPRPVDVGILLAEREIRRRLADYCSGIDRCDEALVASAFHADSRAQYGGFDGQGADFARLTVEMLRASVHLTMHRMGEPRIDFVSEDAAEVETPILAQHVTDAPGLGRGTGHERLRPGEPFLEFFSGWYVDRFEHRDAGWRIAHRTLVHAWDTVLPIDPAFPPGSFDSGLPRK